MILHFQANPFAVDIASIAKTLIKAADKLISLQNTNFEVYRKADNTSVTSADLESNKIIKHELRAYSDRYHIVSEEDKVVNQSLFGNYFLLDPLDGTSSYIKLKRDFTINLAIIINGVAKFGIIVVPFKKKMWLGGDDFDVVCLNYSRSEDYKLEPITYKPIIDKNIRIVESLSSKKTKEDYLNVLKQGYGISKIIKMQAATKFIAILENTADLYYRSTGIMPWDLAAGDAIIKGYGGFSMDVNLNNNFKQIIYPNIQAKTPAFCVARDHILKTT